ncbi:MAG TPA: TolC family protein, partial [Thermodesulfovibrionia bacterium]|nr:TolC family protein [Thermodesulfovibrionia bacterium]
MKKKPHVMLNLIQHLISLISNETLKQSMKQVQDMVQGDRFKTFIRVSIVFPFLLVFIPYNISAQEFSLEELYSLALKNSETIKISEEDLYISERDKDRAMAVLFPTLSTFGSHTRYKEEKSGTTFTTQPEYSTSWGLRLDQSLSLSGRELTALKMAKETIVKSSFDLDNVKEGYLLNVASAYYNLLKSKKAAEIAGANVDRLTKHRDAAQTRLKVGEVTKTVLLRAEAELLGAQSEMIRAENNMKFTKTVLARTVGIEGEYDVRENQGTGGKERELKELDVIIVNCQLSTVNCLKQTALTERTELKTIELERKIAEDEIKYTRGLYWPTLSVEGVYSRREDHPSSSFAIKENIYGALKLNFPFFEGGLRVAEVSQSRARLRQA